VSNVQGVDQSPYSIDLTLQPAATTTSPTQWNPFADPGGPFANLNLTADQQQQIAQIFSQNQPANGAPPTPTQIFDQVQNVLTPQQQQTLQNDLETMRSGHHHHHHHGGGSGSQSNDPLAALQLTSDQQNQIATILQSSQSSSTSPADVLAQIDNVLTPDQQQQLVALFSGGSSGAAQGSTPPYLLNTNA
jgi:Spy/CpxP family protein refolding chaperone